MNMNMVTLKTPFLSEPLPPYKGKFIKTGTHENATEDNANNSRYKNTIRGLLYGKIFP